MGLLVVERGRQREDKGEGRGKEKIKKEEEGQRKDIPTKTWMITMLVRLQVGSKQKIERF